MIEQKFEFDKLKTFISEIEITDFYHACDGTKYEDYIKTKKYNDEIDYHLVFNDVKSEKVIEYLKKLKNAFFSEIDRIIRFANKDYVHDYFKDVYEFLKEVSNNITFDNQLEEWTCKFAHFDEKLVQNKLDKDFKKKIQDFFKNLHNTIMEIHYHLDGIEEYKKCIERIEISPLGNQKIIWRRNTNQLTDLFIKMKEKGIIDTKSENLKRFLRNNFLDKNEIELSESTIDTYFKESSGKSPQRGKVELGDFLESE